jgi:hypothetical protein
VRRGRVQRHGRERIAELHPLGRERHELRLWQVLLQRRLLCDQRQEPLQLVRDCVPFRQQLRRDRRRSLFVYVRIERTMPELGVRQRRDLLGRERTDVLQLPVHHRELLFGRRRLLQAQWPELLQLLGVLDQA